MEFYISTLRTSPCLAFLFLHQFTLLPNDVATQSLLDRVAHLLYLALVHHLALLLIDNVAGHRVVGDALRVLVGRADLDNIIGIVSICLNFELL